jgi:secreted trypsin-like serine protease
MRAIRVLLAAACAFALSSASAEAVVGGKPVPPGQFRYVADVLIGGSFGCSGTLIAPDWVLTAGHCGSITGSLSMGLVPDPAAWPASFYTVQLGSAYADGRGGERHAVVRVIVDSDYIATNGTGNDVTLLRLDAASRIRPMLIAARRQRPSWRPGVPATIAGFGTTSESSSTPPPQMRYARVPITADSYCAQAYPNGLSEVPDDGSFDPATMLCAGYPKGGTDTCEGDSGGPLLVPAGRVYRLVGATSFGKGCAEAGHPGVYARLAEGPIRSFIERFVPQAFAPEHAASYPPHRSRHRRRRGRSRHRRRHGRGR